MSASDLETTIHALLAPGKGILAADESFPSIAKRFASIAIASTEENRRAYREMLFTTPDLGRFISGAILFDESLRQKTTADIPMAEALVKQQIIPGIKVDAGTVALPRTAGEKMTDGLEGLPKRLSEYRDLGARFTKWRAVFTIGAGVPSRACVETNTRSLSLFAAMCQDAGLVPIVEPEILMEGDHTLQDCETVMRAMLMKLFETLPEHGVVLEQMILKSGMVVAGQDCPTQPSDAEVAEATLRCFRRAVPAAVPGIVFLSGGQEDVPATRRLNEISKGNQGPWKITFSYGRALQNPSLSAWKGLSENTASAQKALYHRAKCNGLAALGQYSDTVETAG